MAEQITVVRFLDNNADGVTSELFKLAVVALAETVPAKQAGRVASNFSCRAHDIAHGAGQVAVNAIFADIVSDVITPEGNRKFVEKAKTYYTA